jgi:hypothetical protein
MAGSCRDAAAGSAPHELALAIHLLDSTLLTSYSCLSVNSGPGYAPPGSGVEYTVRSVAPEGQVRGKERASRGQVISETGSGGEEGRQGPCHRQQGQARLAHERPLHNSSRWQTNARERP